MMRVCLIDKASRSTQFGEAPLLEAWQRETQWLWLDLFGDHADAHREILEQRFGIESLVVDDALRSRHPPKFEALGHGMSLMLMRALDEQTTDIRFTNIQLAFFFSDDLLITRHSATSPSTNKVWESLKAGQQPSDRCSPKWMAYRVMRTASDRYLPIVLALETRLEEIETELLDDPSDKLLGELMLYSRELKRLRRVGHYHETAFQSLLVQETNDACPLEAAFRDLYEHAERLTSLSNLYHEITADLINGYVSVSSHRLNNVMRVLTVITAVFVPLTFIAGIYGMNFEHMPELRSKNGYYIVWAVMLGLSVSLLAFFRWRRWL